MHLFRNRISDKEEQRPKRFGGDKIDVAAEIRAAIAESKFLYRKSECYRCGKPKVLPTKSAYIYCDHCATLIDYDYKRCEYPKGQSKYADLIVQRQEELALAIREGDRNRFLELQTEIRTQCVEATPEHYSPRVKGDLEYRKQLVKFLSAKSTLLEFEIEHSNKLIENALSANWFRVGRRDVLTPESFHAILACFQKGLDRTYELMTIHGVLEMEPDNAPEWLQRRMNWSDFFYSWISFITLDCAEEPMKQIDGKYWRLPAVDTEVRQCSGCRAEQHMIPETTAVRCEDCGLLLPH